jgi:hypothetical protein
MASGVARAAASTLDEVGQWVQPVVLACDQVLPVVPAFTTLLPEAGLRRGTVVQVHGSGATSLALALVAACTAAGSWVAAIGLRELGLGAAREVGVALERLLLVDVDPARWATVVAATLDGVDALLVEVPPRLRAADARRLQARLRERGSVVVVVGPAGLLQPDLVVAGDTPSWLGLGRGWGHVQARCVPLEVTGRRGATRPRRGRLWLPGPDGAISLEADDGCGAQDRRAVVPLRQEVAG